jgi:hypothetical protein
VHRQQRCLARCRRGERAQVLASPLERQICVEFVLERNPRDRNAGLEATVDDPTFELSTVRPPAA